MKLYENEKDMPLGEMEKENGIVHHLICNGSRRHVIHYNSSGEHCSEARCEINHRQARNVDTIGSSNNINKNYITKILNKYDKNKY